MIIKVYGKYVENAGISNDGSALNNALREIRLRTKKNR
jgi:hypothetical protein